MQRDGRDRLNREKVNVSKGYRPEDKKLEVPGFVDELFEKGLMSLEQGRLGDAISAWEAVEIVCNTY